MTDTEAYLGSTLSLVDTKNIIATTIKQGYTCDDVWREQPWSVAGATIRKRSVPNLGVFSGYMVRWLRVELDGNGAIV